MATPNTAEILNNLKENNAFNMHTLLSTVIGVGIGALTSFIVNATLVEISLNTFFALYYGCLFTFIGGFVMYKSRTMEESPIDKNNAKKPIIQVFAILIIASGVICILLDKNWFSGMGPFIKVPLYIVLGSSISFSIVFAIIDLINFIGGYFRRMQFRSLIDTPSQIITIALISLMMGGIYGLLFGWMDIEDAKPSSIGVKMLSEERICLVIGIILGGFGGILNEIIGRNLHEKLYKQMDDPFNDEI